MRGNQNIAIRLVTVDSRSVRDGDLFVACRGHLQDGHQYALQAMLQGARVLVVERWIDECAFLTQVKVPNARQALALLASGLFHHPAKNLKILGITGTNGKSTVAALLRHLLNQAGRNYGIVGTVGHLTGRKRILASHTTPTPIELHRVLREMVRSGQEGVAMEVSSHSLDQDRVYGLKFHSSIFTNLSPEHLDYHQTIEAYFRSKQRLFLPCFKSRNAVINIDDSYGRRLARGIKGKKITYAIGKTAFLRGRVQHMSLAGTRWTLEYQGRSYPVESPLIGIHNVSNTLAAIGGAITVKNTPDIYLDVLKSFKGVPGRLEQFGHEKPYHVVVDYAHTADALQQALRTLRPYVRRKLTLVFGCGGDRDRGKRARMGRIASLWADQVILTSDNPRSEDPRHINNEICRGAGLRIRFREILDRGHAIREAIGQARSGDLVLVAGKGHEETQISRKGTIRFSDRSLVKSLVQKKF